MFLFFFVGHLGRGEGHLLSVVIKQAAEVNEQPLGGLRPEESHLRPLRPNGCLDMIRRFFRLRLPGPYTQDAWLAGKKHGCEDESGVGAGRRRGGPSNQRGVHTQEREGMPFKLRGVTHSSREQPAESSKQITEHVTRAVKGTVYCCRENGVYSRDKQLTRKKVRTHAQDSHGA